MSALRAVFQFQDDAVELFASRPIDLVILINSGNADIGGDLEHVEAINVHELFGFGERCTGHASELFIEPEIVLEGHGRERLVFRLDLHLLLGLKCLMQAF